MTFIANSDCDTDFQDLIKNGHISKDEAFLIITKQKDEIIEQMDKIIKLKDLLIEHKDKIIELQMQTIKEMVQMLLQAGVTMDEISRKSSLSIEDITKLLQ